MIEWIIGGLIVAALGSEESKLEKEKSRVAAENERKRLQAEQEARQRKIAEQNKIYAQRFINQYSLKLSPNALISANALPVSIGRPLFDFHMNTKMEEVAIQAYKASDKFIKQSIQIIEIQAQLKEIEQLEHELVGL